MGEDLQREREQIPKRPDVKGKTKLKILPKLFEMV